MGDAADRTSAGGDDDGRWIAPAWSRSGTAAGRAPAVRLKPSKRVVQPRAGAKRAPARAEGAAGGGIVVLRRQVSRKGKKDVGEPKRPKPKAKAPKGGAVPVVRPRTLVDVYVEISGRRVLQAARSGIDSVLRHANARAVPIEELIAAGDRARRRSGPGFTVDAWLRAIVEICPSAPREMVQYLADEDARLEAARAGMWNKPGEPPPRYGTRRPETTRRVVDVELHRRVGRPAAYDDDV